MCYYITRVQYTKKPSLEFRVNALSFFNISEEDCPYETTAELAIDVLKVSIQFEEGVCIEVHCGGLALFLHCLNTFQKGIYTELLCEAHGPLLHCLDELIRESMPWRPLKIRVYLFIVWVRAKNEYRQKSLLRLRAYFDSALISQRRLAQKSSGALVIFPDVSIQYHVKYHRGPLQRSWSMPSHFNTFGKWTCTKILSKAPGVSQRLSGASWNLLELPGLQELRGWLPKVLGDSRKHLGAWRLLESPPQLWNAEEAKATLGTPGSLDLQHAFSRLVTGSLVDS